jgi:RNA polymerase sigma factor (TIGR02999 family)
MESSTRITALLIEWGNGDSSALAELMPLVESELRRLARSYVRRMQPGNTMQTTAVINEAFIRLVDQKRVRWQNRAHFYGIAAKTMRRVLLNHLRDKKRKKRGGGLYPVSLSHAIGISDERSSEIIALDDALNRLALMDERKSRVVEMRYFGGLSVDETAEVLGVSRVTVIRDWTTAKAWLLREMSNDRK